MTTLLDHENLNKEIKDFSLEQLEDLAKEIREFLIYQISKTGGHIGANLGTIELTIALHKVFDSPNEPIIFDTGHIGYTHKILTGRKHLFNSLNTYGGMNRFLTPSESPHDIIEASHAGTAISIGLGIALARRIKGDNKNVVAVIGDSAFAEGSSLEALNHAVAEDSKLVTVINDNGYAISPGFGGLHNIFNSKENKAEIFFESFGMEYFEVKDGHNISQIISSLEKSKKSKKLPCVHVKTEKGHGWAPAKQNSFKAHFLFPYNPISGESINYQQKPTYADLLGSNVENLMSMHKDIVCITPSTIYATGLANVFSKYPERTFDPGMMEQHALSMIVGLGIENLYPIIAYQSTFLQRAFDQLIHDVCFSNTPSMILSTRSGFSGYDNPTHHGLYDISYMRSLPNLSIYYPRNDRELSGMIMETYKDKAGPVLIMMPYGDAEISLENTNNLLEPECCRSGEEIVIITVGNKYKECLEAANELNTGLINLRTIQPISKNIINLLSGYKKIVTVEESILDGGMGSQIASIILDNKLDKELCRIGLPRKFIEPGSNEELSKIYKLDKLGIIEQIKSFWM